MLEWAVRWAAGEVSRGGIAESKLKATMQKERLKERGFDDFCRIYSPELCGTTLVENQISRRKGLSAKLKCWHSLLGTVDSARLGTSRINLQSYSFL